MNNAARSAYTVEITASEEPSLVGKYDSLAEADAALQAQAANMGPRYCVKTWVTVTHRMTGDAYSLKLEILAASGRFAKPLTLAATLESRTRRQLDPGYPLAHMIDADARETLQLWHSRFAGV